MWQLTWADTHHNTVETAKGNHGQCYLSVNVISFTKS